MLVSSIALIIAVDWNDLARDRFCSAGGQKDRESGDIGGVDQMLDRLIGHGDTPHLFQRLPRRLGAPLRHVLDALALDRPRRNGVHPDVVFAEFHRKRLSKADQAPLGRRIGTAVAVAKADRRRGHVDDDAISGPDEVRNDVLCHIEGARQIDPQDGFPFIWIEILDWLRRTDDPALLISTSMPPRACAASATMASIEAHSPTSQRPVSSLGIEAAALSRAARLISHV
jgi:hypothetical protein